MQNSKTWEVCETKCWFSRHANISHFTFKNGIRIARPKRHVRDLKVWRQFVRRDQFNLTERKNSHFWFRMNIFPKGGLKNMLPTTVNCKLKNTIHSVLKKYTCIWNEKFCYSLSSCCSLRSKTSVKFCSVSKKLSVRSGNRNGPPTTRNVLSKDTCNTTQNQHQVTICLQDTNILIRWKFLKFIGFRLVVILLIKFIRIRKRQARFLTVYLSLAKSVWGLFDILKTNHVSKMVLSHFLKRHFITK